MNPAIDTIITAETPEGIEISIRPAGFAVRGCAVFIDMLLVLIAFSLSSTALSMAGQFGRGLLFITAFGLNWFYFVAFELAAGAATPGKRIMGLHVLMVNGLPITPAGSLIRNLMRVVDMLPALYACGIVTSLLRGDGRRLGDLAAGTVVAYRGERERGAFAPASPQPPRVPLTVRQQRAITAFAARVGRLTPERAEEIAAVAAPALVPAADAAAAGPLPVSGYLIAVARWLHGERPSAP